MWTNAAIPWGASRIFPQGLVKKLNGKMDPTRAPGFGKPVHRKLMPFPQSPVYKFWGKKKGPFQARGQSWLSMLALMSRMVSWRGLLGSFSMVSTFLMLWTTVE